jgi:hypothetical protein|tara:strand:+ start:53 stop:508 length:456 start_codon:yes stop_codon:yes gene_type:complete
MPLNPKLLERELLLNVLDKASVEGKEVTPKDWADAIGKYFQMAMFPVAGGNVQGAKSIFVTTLGGPKFASGTSLPMAFSQFALTVSSIPGPGGPTLPPVVPISFAPVFPVGLGGGTTKEIASLYSTIIDVWFRTGIYLNGIPATPVPVPWA